MQSVESLHRLEKICTEREGQENDHMSWNLTSGHNTSDTALLSATNNAAKP